LAGSRSGVVEEAAHRAAGELRVICRRAFAPPSSCSLVGRGRGVVYVAPQKMQPRPCQSSLSGRGRGAVGGEARCAALELSADAAQSATSSAVQTVSSARRRGVGSARCERERSAWRMLYRLAAKRSMEVSSRLSSGVYFNFSGYTEKVVNHTADTPTSRLSDWSDFRCTVKRCIKIPV
jgi:hypothetical protein